MENKNYDEILLKFALENCKKNYSYKINFTLHENLNEFETENLKNTSDNSTLEFTKTLLCQYYFYKVQEFKINVERRKDRINFKKFKIGENNNLTLSTIVSSKNASFKVPIKKDDNSSEYIIVTAEIQKKANIDNYTLFDYITAGISFDSYIGIDFSDKNLNDDNLDNNQYIKAIRGFRETLFNFVRNFEVYGYGAKLINDNNNNYFNLSLNDNPDLKGLNNIKKAYQECLNLVDYNKINYTLSPLLKLIKDRIYTKYNCAKYNIFFLLISNCPKNEDIQKCIDQFIENSYLPLSIVIIGIGSKENEFKNIQNIYNSQICSSKGIKKQRDYIYFSSMMDCNFDDNILKDICLKEIPKQMVEFYKLVNTKPEHIRNQIFGNIRNSIKLLDINNSLYKSNQNDNDDDDSAPPLIMPEIEKKELFKSENVGGNKEDNNNELNYLNNKSQNPIRTNNNNNNFSSIINPVCSIKKRSSLRRKTNENNNNNDEIDILSNIPESEEKYYINTPKGEEGTINKDNNSYKNEEIFDKPRNKENKYIITSEGGPRSFNEYKNPYQKKENIDTKDKQYINTPNGEETKININSNPYNKKKEKINISKNEEDKKYINTPKGEEEKIFNNINPYNNKLKENNDAVEDKKYINTPKGEEENIFNNINPYNNKLKENNDTVEDKKYINTPRGEEVKNNNFIKNDEIKNINKAQNKEDKKYVYSNTPKEGNTNFISILKGEIDKKSHNNLYTPGGEENKNINKNININNPYQKNGAITQNEQQLNNNNKFINNPYQNNNNNNNNNNEKKYYNITPSQNDNQNECSQFKNSQQVSTNPSKNSTLNSISYNICEVEHYSKESQIGSSSKININESNNNQNDYQLKKTFNNYSIDN